MAEDQPSPEPFPAFALLQILVLNGVTLYGVYFLGWPWGTALVLYWCETLLGACFIILRMLLHRGLTHKRGYYRGQLGIQKHTKLRTPFGIQNKNKPFKSFIPEFVTGSLVFGLVHGVFLGFLIGELEDHEITTVDVSAVKKGVAAMALVMVGSFALDCQNLRGRPFAWIRDLAIRSMGRTIVVHLTILLGLFALKVFGLSQFPFILFAVLKILLEIGYTRARPQKLKWEERQDEEVMVKAVQEKT